MGALWVMHFSWHALIAFMLESFNLLADMIAEFPNLASHSYFIFVPGANDPWAGNTLPRPHIPDYFTGRVRQKVKRAIFTSNPTRWVSVDGIGDLPGDNV